MSFRANPIPPLYVGQTQSKVGGFIPVTNEAILIPILIYIRQAFTSISYKTTAAISNADIGVYDNAYNLLRSTGIFAIGSGSNQSLSSSIVLEPNRYWLALCCDGGAGNQFAAKGPIAGFVKRHAGAGIPLPATLAPIDFDGLFPVMILR